MPPRRGGGPPDANIHGRHRRLLAIDDGVWQLRRTLEGEGVLDQTIIVFTSDNGYFHREHGIGDKRWAYEEALRIPMIVRYPPRIQRSEIGRIVLNVDLAPTLLELAGVPAPADMHGRSVVPLFEDEASDWRDGFVAEYFAELGSRVPTWEAVRTESWKFIRYPDLGREFDELYDLDNDAYELTNLALDPMMDELRGSLARQLEERLAGLTP